MPLELVVDSEVMDAEAEALELEVVAALMTIEVTKGLMSFEVDELARMFRR